jgi:hypothetical protein
LRIGFRSLLLIGGGLGVAYAISPKARRTMDPVLKQMKRLSTAIREQAPGAAAPEDWPQETFEDVKAIVRSMSRRLAALERAAPPYASAQANEYAGVPDYGASH